MDNVHRSRARIFFEVLCAFGLSASFAGAWMQLGATAFLPAAGIAALYGLVQGFDLVRSKPAVATAAGESVNADQPDLLSCVPAAEPAPVIDEQAEVAAEPVEPAAKPVKPRRTRAKAKKPTASRQEEVPVVEPAPAFQDDRPIEQLFEPQPFIRQLRPAFGRRDRRPPPFVPTA